MSKIFCKVGEKMNQKLQNRLNKNLLKAVKEGNLFAAKLCIRFGADVNYVDPESKEHETLLHLASKKLDKKMVELLLSKNANANALDINGEPALIYALQAESVKSAEIAQKYSLLASLFMSPSSSNAHFRRVFMIKHKKELEELNLSKTFFKSKETIDNAIQEVFQKHFSVSNVLKEKTNLNFVNKNGKTFSVRLLDFAENNLVLAYASTLLRNPSVLNATDKHGNNLLFRCIGHARLLKIDPDAFFIQAIINNGINTNQKDEKGRTALYKVLRTLESSSIGNSSKNNVQAALTKQTLALIHRTDLRFIDENGKTYMQLCSNPSVNDALYNERLSFPHFSMLSGTTIPHVYNAFYFSEAMSDKIVDSCLKLKKANGEARLAINSDIKKSLEQLNERVAELPLTEEDFSVQTPEQMQDLMDRQHHQVSAYSHLLAVKIAQVLPEELNQNFPTNLVAHLPENQAKPIADAISKSGEGK